VGIGTGYWLHGLGSILAGARIFQSRAALGPTEPPVQWVPGSLSPRIKRLGREDDRSPPSSAEVKNGGAIPPLPHMVLNLLSAGTTVPFCFPKQH
jgi:hypothetical protein